MAEATNGELAVRAGAGTGKTFTMMQRALFLASQGVDPSSILMITFSVKAAAEIRSRLSTAFAPAAPPAAAAAADDSDEDEPLYARQQRLRPPPPPPLPVAKTFHALAFFWVRRFWKAAGLAASPTPLSGKAAERKLMRRVFEEIADEQRLDRLRYWLRSKLADSHQASWDDVLVAAQAAFPEEYARAVAAAEKAVVKADEKALAGPPKKKRKKKGKPDAAEELAEQAAKEEAERQRVEAEAALEQVRTVATRRFVYLEMAAIAEIKYRKQLGPAAQNDAILLPVNVEKPMDWEKIERDWLGPSPKELNKKITFYLDLVRTGRLRRHKPGDYLPDDGMVWERYEAIARRDGLLDFDNMLVVFHELLSNNPRVRGYFQQRYTHLVVDEFQDNSELQTVLLEDMVDPANPQITVVGDDDQCIYQFRGAEPGNFRRLNESYEKLTLVDNYRSTANILRVGAAFLEESKRREPKELEPTREAGAPVELWKVRSDKHQAQVIATEMRRRHYEDGVPWGEMACLLRCFKTDRGPLHSKLQEAFTVAKVPFCVVGGKTLFEKKSIGDLMAYLRLALLADGERDDDAFELVLNRPPRRCTPATMLQLIVRQQAAMQQGETRGVGLEEAARAMCITGVGLKPPQRKALTGYLKTLDELRDGVASADLIVLLQRIWSSSGLEEWHGKQTKKKNDKKAPAVSAAARRKQEEEEDDDSDDSDSDDSEEDEEGEEGEEGEAGDSATHARAAEKTRKKFVVDDDDDDDEGGAESMETEEVPQQATAAAAEVPQWAADTAAAPLPQPEPAALPELPEITALIAVANVHVEEWQAKEAALALRKRAEDASSVPSLFELSCKRFVELEPEAMAREMARGPPIYLVDEAFASQGRGRKVAADFATEIALQNADDDLADPTHDPEDKVSLSTIHRAKGLEWRDTFVPYVNEGLMPCAFKEEKANTAQRHVRDCAARQPGCDCNKNCAAFYKQGDAHERGTPEERHEDEERRLAHVAATRAKDRLVLLSIQPADGGGRAAGGRGWPGRFGRGGGRGRGRGDPPKWQPSSYEKNLAALPEDVFVTKTID